MITQTAQRLISLDEDLIALGDIADTLPKPKSGRKVARATIHRWIHHGLAGAAPLETVRVGGSIFTSREALRRFFDRVSEAKDGHLHGAKPTPTKAGEKADAMLAAAGL